MELFRIEKNTPNLELKKFKKGLYKIIVSYDGVVELEVLCKISKKTSDYFYFKVEEKNIQAFKRLEELKLGYFVIPEQPEMAVVEVQPEETVIEFNKPKQEESIMTNVNYTVADLQNINGDVLEEADNRGISYNQLIQAVNNLPGIFQPQINQAVQHGLTDLEARIGAVLAMYDLMGLSTPTNKEDTSKNEDVKNNANTKTKPEPEPQVKPEPKPETQAKAQTKPEGNNSTSIVKTVAKTTAGIALGAGIAYGLYKLAKEYF